MATPSSSPSMSQQIIATLVGTWRTFEASLPPTIRTQAVSVLGSARTWCVVQFSAHPWLLPLVMSGMFMSLVLITLISCFIFVLIWPFLLTGAGVTLFHVLSASIVVEKQHLVQHNYFRLYIGFLCQLACIIPVIVMGPTLIWLGFAATTYYLVTSGKTHPLVIAPLLFLLVSVPYWSICWWLSAWLYHILYFCVQGMLFAAYVTHHAATWWKVRAATQQQQQQQQQRHEEFKQQQDGTSTVTAVPITTKTAAAMPTPSEATPMTSSIAFSASVPRPTVKTEASIVHDSANESTSMSTPPSRDKNVKENQLKRQADGTLVDVDGTITQHEQHHDHPMHVSVAGEIEEMREPETPPTHITHPIKTKTKPISTVTHVSEGDSNMETPSH